MPTQRHQLLTETQQARARATELLRSLLDAKAACEAHVAAANRTDPIKAVTGRSAIDTAVASTRRMIEALDRAMDEARKTLDDEDFDALDDINAEPVLLARR